MASGLMMILISATIAQTLSGDLLRRCKWHPDRYERSRGEDTESPVQGREPGTRFRTRFIPDRISTRRTHPEVADGPLQNASLLQDFLDKHIILGDLRSREQHLLTDLENNSGVLRPLEVAIVQLPTKRLQLTGLNQKLQIAETGKVREIVSQKKPNLVP